MTLQLTYVGLVMVAVGLGSFYATGTFAAFNFANLIGGGVSIAVALLFALRGLRAASGPHARALILRGALLIAASMFAGAALERLAHFADVRFDWTFEKRFEIAPATVRACREAGPELRATLHHAKGDPRTRRTRLLLQTLARACPLDVRARELDGSDAETLGVGSSNTVVFQTAARFETAERPTEGALYEALYRLRASRTGKLLALRGEGEGDLEGRGGLGFSGLATALRTEGYEVESVVTSMLEEVPADVSSILILGARRPLPKRGIDTLRRHLESAGHLVVLLEPGVQTGLEDLLAEYGLVSPAAVLVDPVSGLLEGAGGGLDPIASNYDDHPVTRGLDRNRTTYFSGARSFALRKVRADDEIRSVVLASPRSWLHEDPSVLRQPPERLEPDGARRDYHPLAVAGKYRRGAGETRIVAFGDSDFSSNRYLRAAYNLDLILNAVHWAAQRESEITLRPKTGAPLHFPLPLTSSLSTFYGVGMLVPELLLIGGGLIGLRRRSA